MAKPEPFPNADLLWSAEQLHARLEEKKLVVLDVRPSHQIMSGVIPGAAHFPLFRINPDRTTPELMAVMFDMYRLQFSLRGIAQDRTVVAYEQSQTGMIACRAFWLLEYMGHRDVHVLDGGIAAWQAAGFETVRELKPPTERKLELRTRPETFISADELNAALGDDGLVVLDTRPDAEYLGKETRGGPRGGTIPGSVHLESGRYLDDTGRLKPPAELLALFESQGVLRDKAIVPF